jgi:putative NADH-flavin reductase
MTVSDKTGESGSSDGDRSHGEALLDEALDETFPASDPTAVGSEIGRGRERAATAGLAVALIGITGRVGARLADELLARGHRVTGIARDPTRVAPRPGLRLAAGDATQPAALAPLLAGHDAVISATKAETADPAALLAAVRAAGVPRLLVVGGAGSLEVSPGTMLLDRPSFPPAFATEARAAARFLARLRAETQLDWTYLSPSAELVPGTRTGAFRLGGDQLLVDDGGRSWVSMEDFAVALVDELERPRHSRARFTVGY